MFHVWRVFKAMRNKSLARIHLTGMEHYKQAADKRQQSFFKHERLAQMSRTRRSIKTSKLYIN